MTLLRTISAILIMFAIPLFTTAGPGERKMHDHQQTKDHIKRDRSSALVERDGCARKPDNVMNGTEAQDGEKIVDGDACEPTKKKMPHDHRKSKNL